MTMTRISWRRNCSWVCCHHRTAARHTWVAIHWLEMLGIWHNTQTAPTSWESRLCRKQVHSSLGWWTKRLQIMRQNRWWKWMEKGGWWFWKRLWECQISCYETWKLLCWGATRNFRSEPQVLLSLKRIPVVSSAGPTPIFYAFCKTEWDALFYKMHKKGKVNFGLKKKLLARFPS